MLRGILGANVRYYRDTLTQSLMNGLAQGIVEIRLAAEDEGKAVDRVIAVIHEHFNIIEDSGGAV